MEGENISQMAEGQAKDKSHDITVTVNNKYEVTFDQKAATGAQIKAASIAQGVPGIEPDFDVFEVRGSHQERVGDLEPVKLHNNQKFLILRGDHNS